ncbi:hypothetical protein B0A54_13877 [Friedmanniomyces endolithicus]|uniref:F-box domain-containing protein n=1 Tax=Friedmanniomyces endolithicus TaxID=329885 RepID=A0A4U0UHC0_9PEZI|nr:hypothetical protein LTS09_001909 [Friedmanniomyces endolithicus]TKA34914.1 hypothetical protein B0A54_13877 [Friedmanniomyces endolithicus]
MFRKLRTASQQWATKRRDSLISTRPTQTPNNNNPTSASFLGLPPEIRNQIYHHLASTTTLTLPPVRPRKGPQPIGLLLACKQTHAEFRALLLSQANLLVWISGFDFSGVVRMLRVLPPKDREALQINPHLCLSIFLSHVPSREERRALLDWLLVREDTHSDETLVFRYDVHFNVRLRPPRPPSRYVNGYHMRRELLQTLIWRLEQMKYAVSGQGFVNLELVRMVEDLQACADVLKEVMDDPAAG